MLLHLIWTGSLALAGISLGAMCLLIVLRVINERRERRRLARQKELRQEVFRYLENPEGVSELVRNLTRHDIEAIRDTAEDLARVIRGSSSARLARLIAELGGSKLFAGILRSGAEDERLRAVASLALFPDAEGEKLLKAAVGDSSPRVQLAAAHALADLGLEVSVEDLIERLDIGDEVRSRSLRELFRELAPRRKDEMLGLLNTDLPDMVKGIILYGLAGLRDPRLLPQVMEMFDSPSVDIRAETMRALAAIGHPRAEPVILEGLIDDSWVVRSQAAICAGVIGLPAALPFLEQLLTDDQWWVRFRAARALLRLGEAGHRVLERLAATAGPAQRISQSALAEEGNAA